MRYTEYCLFIILMTGLLPSTLMLQLDFNNRIFAQNSVSPTGSSSSDIGQSPRYNNYDNIETGISIKYPSNFLIDTSNSNESFKQISFFPPENADTYFPENFITWFDVIIQTTFHQDLKSSSNVSKFLENRVNSIQEGNADVTILEKSTRASLSGYPAYKLITRSFSDNSLINNIEIGTLIGNKLYELNYEVNASNYEKSLPVANNMIDSFRIYPSLESSILSLFSNSTKLSLMTKQIPMSGDLLSVKINNQSNG